MINFFDTLYTFIHIKHNPLSRYFLYPFLRIPTLYFVNLFVPIYFRITANKDEYKLKKSDKASNRIIVSLTSFPPRINRVWLVIESIMRQELKPDKILLWLSKEQFSSLSELPKNLLRLQDRGLEIRFCNENLKAHTKYYYAMQEFPDDIIITVDDDILYNSYITQHLIELSEKYPQTICCCRGWEVKINDRNLAKYNEWKMINDAKSPSIDIFPTGVGGVLYPPHSLHKDVFNIDLLRELCFYADDVWLNVMAHLKGTKYAKTEYSSHYLPIKFKNRTRLRDINVTESANDTQINNLRNYYKKILDKDPYHMLFR